jgi:hypothetical protein
MARRCTVCDHPQRAEIDHALVENGTPNRRIAAVYSVAETSLRRHKAAHIPRVLVTAQERAEVQRGDSLTDQVKALQSKALQLLQAAEAKGDTRTALLAVRELARLVELLTRAFPPEVLEEARRIVWIRHASKEELDAFILAGPDDDPALAKPRVRTPSLW